MVTTSDSDVSTGIMNLSLNDSKHLENISFSLEQKISNLNKTKREENLLLKWSFAANVLDRFFLIISLIYVFITFLAKIASNPNFYHFK